MGIFTPKTNQQQQRQQAVQKQNTQRAHVEMERAKRQDQATQQQRKGK